MLISSVLNTETLILLTISTLVSARNLTPLFGIEIRTPSTASEAQDGLIATRLSVDCKVDAVSSPKDPGTSVPIDQCFPTPNLSLAIQQAAICANGTIAKWARFTDSKCGNGIIDSKFGLLELTEADVGKCQILHGVDGPESKDKVEIASVAFWCEGVKSTSSGDDKKEPVKETPKDHRGIFNEGVCAGKAPFFHRAEPDSCVNLRTERLKVFDAGICANGTHSTLALYKDKGCSGAPASFKDITEEVKKTCLDLKGVSSFAFWCTGEGIESKAPKGGNGGGVGQFLIVLLLILLMFVLMLVLSVLAWVNKYGGSVGKLLELVQRLFAPKDRGIQL